MQPTASGDERLLCPVVGSFVNDGLVSGRHGTRTSVLALFSVLRHAGMTITASVVLIVLSVFTANGWLGLVRNVATLSVDLHHLGGHVLDRQGGSGVLRTAGDAGTDFDPMAMRRLLAFSSDGSTLTVADIGRMLEADTGTGASASTSAISRMWFAALVRMFGVTQNRLGRSGIRLRTADLRSLYEQQRLPEGWEPKRRTSILSVLVTMRRIASSARSTT